MRIAVIDMGTNVYNLLLAEVNHGVWNRMHEMKQPARLGDGGLGSGILTDRAFRSAAHAMSLLTTQLTAWDGAEKTYALATSAVREAKNGLDFTQFIEKKYRIPVQIISGDREAELICKGIRQGAPLTSEPVLMLDIGGGSNEFIIANDKEIYWKQSFPLGMARLLEKFKPGNPITAQETTRIQQYLDAALAPLWKTLEQYKITTLVGSSGSFDTYRSMLAAHTADDTPSHPIAPDDFNALHATLLHSTAEERMAMKGMTPVRVDFIVLAVIFTHLVIHKAHLTNILQCSYSLKEGFMQEICKINENK
jgi:exopolyphosphatase/guanosine-5'-triphosphate,3'-diphosphate pyrophosphatase